MGAPLVIGISDERTFIASETSAFNRFTKNFISMKDGELVSCADERTLDLSRKQLAPDQEVILSQHLTLTGPFGNSSSNRKLCVPWPTEDVWDRTLFARRIR
jgi:hypothetical protein